MELEKESPTCLTVLNKVYTLKGRFVGEIQTSNYQIKGKRHMIRSPLSYIGVAYKKGEIWKMNCIM